VPKLIEERLGEVYCLIIPSLLFNKLDSITQPLLPPNNPVAAAILPVIVALVAVNTPASVTLNVEFGPNASPSLPK